MSQLRNLAECFTIELRKLPNGGAGQLSVAGIFETIAQRTGIYFAVFFNQRQFKGNGSAIGRKLPHGAQPVRRYDSTH